MVSNKGKKYLLLNHIFNKVCIYLCIAKRNENIFPGASSSLAVTGVKTSAIGVENIGYMC